MNSLHTDSAARDPRWVRFVSRVRTETVSPDELAAVRDRLRDRFPRGATRRMTHLGMLVGAALLELEPQEADAVIYASSYAETRALEAYLESFPAASPTLFQTSIHPSAVQQALIGRQQPLREFLPITGAGQLVAQAWLAAFLSPAARVIVCGGEEQGTWLLQQEMASERTFAFAVAISRSPEGALARVDLNPAAASEPGPNLSLPEFFDRLVQRASFSIQAPETPRLTWTWA